MTTLTDLLERVKAATGPDRELDHALWLHFDETAKAKHDAGRIPLPWTWCLTSSVDDALALVERLLPGTASERTSWRNHYRCTLIETDEKGWHNGGKHFRVDASSEASEPLAIIAALLQALTQEPK
ncbi:MAG TPA: hypothetical protein VGN60_07765 [Devosia sp.]|nr:hypothetical protein [Devosia sp.]